MTSISQVLRNAKNQLVQNNIYSSLVLHLVFPFTWFNEIKFHSRMVEIVNTKDLSLFFCVRWTEKYIAS